MKNVKVSGGGFQLPQPFLIRWAPRRERRWRLGETMGEVANILYFDEIILLSETSEKYFFLYFVGRYTPELFLDLGI